MFKKSLVILLALIIIFPNCKKKLDHTANSEKNNPRNYTITISGLNIINARGDTILTINDSLAVKFSIDSIMVQTFQDSLLNNH